jgi:hypothetical protein
MNEEWIDNEYAYTGKRNDGARVGGFWLNGKLEWWAYPSNYSMKLNNALGPFSTMNAAKDALDGCVRIK